MNLIIIALIDPILYYRIHVRLLFANLLNANIREIHNLQLIDTYIKNLSHGTCMYFTKGHSRKIG